MLIAIQNESTLVSNNEALLMCQAVQIQFNLHACPAYNVKPTTVTFYPDKTKIPGYAWVISILDTPDVANALGYHNETAGRPNGFVFCAPILNNGGGVLNGKDTTVTTVSSVLSHEALELNFDRFCSTYCDNGIVSWALEVSDPCQDLSYVINVNGTEVFVSDFVFPSFFNPQATSANEPFDYMNKLTAPFTITRGGYSIQRKSGPGSETQVFGENVSSWKKAAIKTNKSGRVAKRQTPRSWPTALSWIMFSVFTLSFIGLDTYLICQSFNLLH